MIQIDDMATFVAVVETGSVTAAATRLNTTKSVVSRRLSDVERELGTTLIERGARGARTTEVGAVYYAKCLRILESIHAANDFVAGFNNVVSGPLKLVLSRTMHDGQIESALNRFVLEHPELVLQIDVPGPAGLAELDFDAVLQSGEPEGADLIARPLFEFTNVICASPDYLQRRGMPQTADDMVDHDVLLDATGGMEDWYYLAHGKWTALRFRTRMSCREPRQLLSAALAGVGLYMAPESIVAGLVAAGRLQRVLPDLTLPRNQFSVFYPRSRRTSRKVQLLLSFLRDAYETENATSASD